MSTDRVFVDYGENVVGFVHGFGLSDQSRGILPGGVLVVAYFAGLLLPKTVVLQLYCLDDLGLYAT